jgi:putative flippase GtrA
MPDTLASDDRESPPDSLPRRIADAFGWGLAIVVSNIINLGATWRDANQRERLRLILAVVRIAIFVFIAVADSSYLWLWIWVVALSIVEAFADLDDVATSIAANRRTMRMLAQQPTGAPRTAEIRCSQGVVHRFLYGPAGWEEAGPADHHA